MKKMYLGAQLYTVRQHMKTPDQFAETMEKVAEIGYKYVQVSAVDPSVTASDIAKVANDTGLKVVLTHTPAKRLFEETEKVIEEHDLFGCDCIGLGMANLSELELAKGFVERITPVLEKIKAAGKTFLYHNHGGEFQAKYEGGNALDYLLANTDPEVLKLTFDAYWCYCAGEDVPASIRKYSNRIGVTHLKDYLKKDETGKRIMTEVLTGVIDYDAIMEAYDEQNILWHFVEQDDVYMDAFDSLKISYDNLKQRYSNLD